MARCRGVAVGPNNHPKLDTQLICGSCPQTQVITAARAILRSAAGGHALGAPNHRPMGVRLQP